MEEYLNKWIIYEFLGELNEARVEEISPGREFVKLHFLTGYEEWYEIGEINIREELGTDGDRLDIWNDKL